VLAIYRSSLDKVRGQREKTSDEVLTERNDEKERKRTNH
jgi:hypothetical protein